MASTVWHAISCPVIPIPKAWGWVELAVLVDRGHREFPIRPDYMGLNLPTERHQSVNVFLSDDQNRDHATLENYKYRISQPASAVA